MERLMLLDGFGLVYRGYYALPPLTTSKGELVNGVFGFCSIVLRGIADLKPDYVAVAFDLSGPTFRHEQYAEYKATRTRMPDDLAAQFPKVREVVKALRIPVYELQGFEADDVIGALDAPGRDKGHRDDDRHGRPGHAPAGNRSNPGDDDPFRRGEHDHLRPGPDLGALRPSARPDDRLQGAQGRPDGQHPGRARSGGEDGREADRGVGHARRHVRADRRREAGQAARQAHRASGGGLSRPGPDDDRARPAGHRARPAGGAARRLRPRDGHPPVPRVRVPDPDRAAARDVRRERGRQGAGAARGRRGRLGRGGASRHGPAGRLGLGAPDSRRVARGRGPPAVPRLRHRVAGLAAGRCRVPGGRAARGGRRGRPAGGAGAVR